MSSGWPKRSPRRFRALIMPGTASLIGLLVLLLTPVPVIGLALLLGGVSALVIAGFIAAIGY